LIIPCPAKLNVSVNSRATSKDHKAVVLIDCWNRALFLAPKVLLSLFLVFFPSWYYTQDLANHGLWLALSLFMLMRSFIMLGYYLLTKVSGFKKS
jgi:hypothetical protein